MWKFQVTLNLKEVKKKVSNNMTENLNFEVYKIVRKSFDTF